MTTWLVFITANTVWGVTANQEAADEIQAELTRLSGRTGQPGIDPEAVLVDGAKVRIRQSFPYVTPTQAVMMAGESLRRLIRAEEIGSIEAVQLDDWLTAARPAPTFPGGGF